ncbi:hypothetical protein ACIG87_18575 [Micromonospora sp. NPDC051925]
MPAEGTPHLRAYDLVAGRFGPAADSAEELIVEMPFDIRLCRWDVTR